jgi:hypothetical protein
LLHYFYPRCVNKKGRAISQPLSLYLAKLSRRA